VTERVSCARVRRHVSDALSVLVVDDEPTVSLVFERLLRRLGYSVELTTTAAAAFALLEARLFDVCLIDKNLPDASGVEVARFARQTSPGAVIVMITGYASIGSATELLGIADDYLTKPFELDQLKETLSSLLARRRAEPLDPVPSPLSSTDRRPGTPHVHLLVDLPGDAERLNEAIAALPVTSSAGPLPEQAPELLVLSGALATFEVRKVVWAWQARAPLAVVMLVDTTSVADAMAAVALKATARLTRPLDIPQIKRVLEQSLPAKL
jgi:DNA-binding NtrC family response regulator